MSKESITYKSALDLAIQALTDAAAQIDAVSWRWPKKWLNKHQRDQLQRAALLKAAAQKLQASIQKPR